MFHPAFASCVSYFFFFFSLLFFRWIFFSFLNLISYSLFEFGLQLLQPTWSDIFWVSIIRVTAIVFVFRLLVLPVSLLLEAFALRCMFMRIDVFQSGNPMFIALGLDTHRLRGSGNHVCPRNFLSLSVGKQKVVGSIFIRCPGFGGYSFQHSISLYLHFRYM
jgi:hypothetical protein